MADYKLEFRLFSFFGKNAKAKDTYKDVDKKGIWERYNEVLGSEYDDGIQDLLDNFVDRTIVPSKMKATLLPLMEYMLGGILFVSGLSSIRRKIIKYAHLLYNVKGTIRGFEIPLFMLGFTSVTIQDIDAGGNFDSD